MSTSRTDLKEIRARFVLHSDCTVAVAHNHGHLSTKHVKLIETAIRQNFDEIVEDWRRLFGSDVHFDK